DRTGRLKNGMKIFYRSKACNGGSNRGCRKKNSINIYSILGPLKYTKKIQENYNSSRHFPDQ
ncbi:MAG: hypothetical protein V4676_00050, partial [Bacteroidota bacterium]